MLLAIEIVALMRALTEFALEALKSMPEAAKADFLQRHNDRMEFWHAAFAKLKTDG